MVYGGWGVRGGWCVCAGGRCVVVWVWGVGVGVCVGGGGWHVCGGHLVVYVFECQVFRSGIIAHATGQHFTLFPHWVPRPVELYNTFMSCLS